MTQHNFLWFDCETTGLDEHNGRLLEVAAVLANDGPHGDMMPLHRWEAVIHVTPGDLASVPIDEYVQGMHTRNGLWDAVSRSTVSRDSVDRSLAGLCSVVWPDGRVVLAGGSVHFDLRWARVHLPIFAAFLSHRVLDVSSLKASERMWGAPFDNIKSDAHRAMPDALASLTEARLLRQRRWPAPLPEAAQ